jgi:hypothetical protein
MRNNVKAWTTASPKVKVRVTPEYNRVLKNATDKDLLDIQTSLSTLQGWYSHSAGFRNELYKAAEILVRYFRYDPYRGPVYRAIEVRKSFSKLSIEGKFLKANVAHPVASSWTTSISNAINFGKAHHNTFVVVKLSSPGLQLFNSNWFLSVLPALHKLLKAVKKQRNKSLDKDLLYDCLNYVIDLNNNEYLEGEDEIVMRLPNKVKIQVAALINDRIVRSA